MYGSPILVVGDRQKKIVDLVLSGVSDLDDIASRLGCRREDLMRDVEELRSMGLVELERRQVSKAQLTPEAERYVNLSMPEERLAAVLEVYGGAAVSEIPSLAARLGVEINPDEVALGLQHLAREGCVEVRGDTVVVRDLDKLREAGRRARGLREALASVKKGLQVDEATLGVLRRRKLVRARTGVQVFVRATDKAAKLSSEGLLVGGRLITSLTTDIIRGGQWRGAVFKRYDLAVPPPRLYPGRRHPYLLFLDYVRELLVSMGFEEVKGPHVELELWNFDALFQAQDHPAREIHDTFFLKYPARGKVGDEGLLERIRRVHEDGGDTGSLGWRYRWDQQQALRLILRTQTTAVSARTIYQRGDGEYRCFSLDRVFRPENLDARHSMEFYQLEGIIVSEKVTFKHLLGFFEELASRLKLGPIRFKPAYFPFTEPSVEGFIKHRKLGWIEVFPGGMFRPEVLRPLGVAKANVAAWGIGIDRIAMAVLGIDDIRLLFAQDLDFIRGWRHPLWVA